MKLKVWIAAAALITFVGGTTLFAEEVKKAEPKAMSAEEKAMMEAWMKASTPGEGQKALDGMTGNFDAKVTSWMAPGAPPMTSDGSCESKWVLGGRYVQQTFTGSFMGMPFSGIGYTGYDNVTKKYFGTWMDNMSTGVMNSTGSTADNGKTFTFNATMADPMTGKDSAMQEKVTVVDHDKHIFEMWAPGPDGKMFKTMEIVYSRKK